MTQIRCGSGGLARVAGELDRPATVVTGEASARRSGALDRLLEAMDRARGSTAVVAVTSHPGPDAVDRVLAQACLPGTVLIGLGGGSVLDVTKVAASRLAGSAGWVAIPTLWGSGAEVTPFAALWDRTVGKLSLRATPARQVVVLPELASGAPQSHLATAALDCIAHAVDVSLSNGPDRTARRRAELALGLTARHMPGVLRAVPRSLTRMAAASILGGLALAGGGSGPSHALSYPLRLRHDIPHGLSCALLLPGLVRAAGRQEPAMVAPVARALRAPDAEGAARRLETLIEGAGFPLRLGAHGVVPSEVDQIVAEAEPIRLARTGFSLDARRMLLELL